VICCKCRAELTLPWRVSSILASCPRDAGSSGRCALLINLRLQGSFDLGYFLFTAKLLLHPADDDLRGEVGVGDDVAFRCLKANAAICASGVGAVVGVNRVMHRDDDAIGCVALHLGNAPGGGSGRQSGGSHEMISDGDSVPELGAEVSKVTGPSWCEQPDPDVKGTTQSQPQLAGLPKLRCELGLPEGL